MSPFPIVEGKVARKYAKGARVVVTPKTSDPEPLPPMPGSVVRRQGRTYVVQLDAGPRWYGESDDIQPEAPP